MIETCDMIFDPHKKRYYLSEQYVYNQLGTNMKVLLDDELDTNRATIVKRNIQYACDMVYGYLCENAYDKNSALYIVTQNEDCNQSLKRALSYQVLMYAFNGDLTMDISTLPNQEVNRRAIQELKSGDILTTYVFNVPNNVEEW